MACDANNIDYCIFVCTRSYLNLNLGAAWNRVSCVVVIKYDGLESRNEDKKWEVILSFNLRTKWINGWNPFQEGTEEPERKESSVMARNLIRISYHRHWILPTSRQITQNISQLFRMENIGYNKDLRKW